jgi:hypothetical protein
MIGDVGRGANLVALVSWLAIAELLVTSDKLVASSAVIGGTDGFDEDPIAFKAASHGSSH